MEKPKWTLAQPNISRRKRTLDTSNNQTGLRTDTLDMLCSLLIWLQSLPPCRCNDYTQTPWKFLQYLAILSSGPLHLLFPYLECFSSRKRGFPLSWLLLNAPKPFPAHQIIKAHVYLFYISIMDTFRFITANFSTSLIMMLSGPLKSQMTSSSSNVFLLTVFFITAQGKCILPLLGPNLLSPLFALHSTSNQQFC